MKHIRDGVTFNLSNAKKWIAAPISNLEFKLVENDTKILVKCTPSQDQALQYYMYKWANTIMVYDKAKNSWIKSKTGWVGAYRSILVNYEKKVNKTQLDNMLRAAAQKYFYENAYSLIITHDENYHRLSTHEKKFAMFIVQSDGYLRINWAAEKVFYLGHSNPLKTNFSWNFLGKCCRPLGSIKRSTLKNYSQLGKCPFKVLYMFQIISTLNRDDYWFGPMTYTITKYCELEKKVVAKKHNFIQTAGKFVGLEHKKSLTANGINAIKKFNNLDQEVKDAKIDDVISASEHAYFLYDNQNLIHETFISEINKHVHLIGSISFFDKIAADGKIFLIKTRNKLKFDVKKMQKLVILNLIFLLRTQIKK